MEKENVTIPVTFLCILLVLRPLVVVCGFRQASAPLTPAMFVFGDSLIDSGNNNYLPTIARANYFPYGVDFGQPTGRFCNGLTAVDYGARYLGLPLIPPYLSPWTKGRSILKGLNYASAAAGILDETGQHYGARTTFNQQISQFETTTRVQLPIFFQNSNELMQYIAKSVFLINIGSNDYINNFLQPKKYLSSHIYSAEGFADFLINTLSQQLSRLYRLGARKIAVVGIGPLGCIPSQLSKVGSNIGCVEYVNDLVTMFNSRLIPLTKNLNASLPGSFFVHQNTYDLFYKIVRSPSQYGSTLHGLLYPYRIRHGVRHGYSLEKLKFPIGMEYPRVIPISSVECPTQVRPQEVKSPGFLVSNRACCGNGKNGGDFTCLPLQQPCTNRNQYVFWDSFHPTEAVNAIVASSCYSEFATNCYPINIYQLAQL